jgi:hypothetical protein
MSHHRLGVAWEAADDPNRAEDAYRRGLEPADRVPYYWAHRANGLARLLITRGELDAAEPLIARSLAEGLPLTGYEARAAQAELLAARGDEAARPSPAKPSPWPNRAAASRWSPACGPSPQPCGRPDGQDPALLPPATPQRDEPRTPSLCPRSGAAAATAGRRRACQAAGRVLGRRRGWRGRRGWRRQGAPMPSAAEPAPRLGTGLAGRTARRRPHRAARARGRARCLRQAVELAAGRSA